MKPIPTEYDGYKFRSRAEARHAVFFNELGVRYVYEPEGYDLDGEWYLPDFYLPELATWVEVKGQLPTEGEFLKATKLAQASREMVVISWGYFDGWLQSVSLWTDEDGCFHSDHGIQWLPDFCNLREARSAAKRARF